MRLYLLPADSARMRGLGAFVLALLIGACGNGCTTRSSRPILGADSTLVYTSRLPGDVNASISLSLKGSKKREEERREARDKARQAAREARKAERRERSRADREQGRKSTDAAEEGASAVDAPAPAAGSAAEPQAAQNPPDERSFDLEDGARVQAAVQLENPYGRGKRPLLFHMVWLNPGERKVFKKIIEWSPNDSSSTITTQLTISPQKRTPGLYTLQVFLFRELIAERRFQLRGTSTATEEKDQGGGM